MARDGKNIHIPIDIIHNILLRLSIEDIFICRNVCKAWHGLMKKPEFTKKYFAGAARTEAYSLIRHLDYNSVVSRELYFVDPKNYMCDISDRLSLGTSSTIPLGNFENLLKSDSLVKFTKQSSGGEQNRYPHCDDHYLEIMNTCKGFLCLTGPKDVIVSNPITGEFVNVPTAPTVAGAERFSHGKYSLGFCQRTNTYKVIRISGCSSGEWVNYPSPGYDCLISSSAQIHTLGSTLWENIGLAPSVVFLEYPNFLKGSLYWLYDDLRARFIVSFDFESNRFTTCSLPFIIPAGNNCFSIRIGVLKEQLCCCAASSRRGHLEIWILESISGVQGEWTKVRNVNLSGNQIIECNGFYQPITRPGSGSIILFHRKNFRRYGLMYYEPEKQILKYFTIQGSTESYEAIGYIPTYISLKNVLHGNEVEVLNDYHRCVKLGIPRDNSPISLLQEDLSKISEPFLCDTFFANLV